MPERCAKFRQPSADATSAAAFAWGIEGVHVVPRAAHHHAAPVRELPEPLHPVVPPHAAMPTPPNAREGRAPWRAQVLTAAPPETTWLRMRLWTWGRGREVGRASLAVVVPDAGGLPEAAALQCHLHASAAKGVIARYAVSERFVFAASLPKTSVAKIDKKQLRLAYGTAAPRRCTPTPASRGSWTGRTRCTGTSLAGWSWRSTSRRVRKAPPPSRERRGYRPGAAAGG